MTEHNETTDLPGPVITVRLPGGVRLIVYGWPAAVIVCTPAAAMAIWWLA